MTNAPLTLFCGLRMVNSLSLRRSLSPSYVRLLRGTWPTRGATMPDRDDLEEAAAMRAEAARELAQARSQTAYVSRLTARLIERRALNHFGDDIQITFNRREP